MDLRVLALLVAQSAPAPGNPFVEDEKIVVERAADDAAYAAFVHERQLLLSSGHGEGWIAIANGEVMPRDASGAVAPAESLAAVLAVADARSPDARHRFVFRIDDPLRVDDNFVAPNLVWCDALGNRCIELLGRDFSVSGDAMTFGRAPRVHRFARSDLTVDFPLRNPQATNSIDIQVVPSTGYDGVFMLTRATAARLGLAPFEVPGAATLECLCDPGHYAACRRARVRVVLDDIGLDEVVPVVIWPDPSAPLAEPPPGAAEKAAAMAIAQEREADEAEYASAYVPRRERLIDRGAAGRWLAIANGECIPREPGTETDGDLRGVPAPVATLEELLAKVEAAAPDAKHRFVFRVGEEGEVAASFLSPTLPGNDALGGGLFEWIGPEISWTFGAGAGWFSRGEKRVDLAVDGPRYVVPFQDPAGGHAVALPFLFSGPFRGTIVLNPASARRLGCERFEIPGVARLGPDSDATAACRRARLRIVLPGIELDRIVPIAVWPEQEGK